MALAFDGISDLKPATGVITVSDAAYSSAWDGSVTVAPSRNATYDKLESVVASLGALTTGSYTPTVTAGANISATTPYVTNWSRVNNRVSVFGVVDLNVTAVSTITTAYISLPVASDLISSPSSELAGSAIAGGTPTVTGPITPDTIGDRALLTFYPPTGFSGVTRWTFNFSYIAPSLIGIAVASVSDAAYNASTWDAVTNVAPSQNAVRDKIESLNLTAGTYTPTVTNVAGLTITSVAPATYMRVVNMVSVAGQFNATHNTAAQFRALVSLPIASNFVATTNCSGLTGISPAAVLGLSGVIDADVTNKAAQLWLYSPAGTTTPNFTYQFMYQVL